LNGEWRLNVELLCTTTLAPQSRAEITLFAEDARYAVNGETALSVLLNDSSPSIRTCEPRIISEVEPVLSTVSPR
jgi:hypothetical protein